MSRLSKRMTRKPRAASWRQKSSSQWIIWAPSPMISSSGSAAGVAENLVANVDAVGAGDLRRLMGDAFTFGLPSSGTVMRNCMARFPAPQKALPRAPQSSG